MAETVTAKVLRGARLLDKKYPGWEKKISLPELDLNSCEVCVLGQLYGIYETGLGQVFEDGDRSDGFKRYHYGFSDLGTKDRMRHLTQVWGRLILSRLAKLFNNGG